MVPKSFGSKVQLTLFGIFRMHPRADGPQLSPVVGVKDIQWTGERAQLTLSSIPFHDRRMDRLAPAQGQGLLTLFGIRDALQELQHWRGVARNSQAQFAYIHVHVDIGVASSGVITRQHLREQGAQMRFLNVKRCAAEMQKEWLQCFAEWVQQEGGNAARDMQHVRQMALRPDLFERLLHTDPDLRHIDVLVLPLADRNDVARVRQVAYLRAGTPFSSDDQSQDELDVRLPLWMAHRPQGLAV